VKHGVFFVFDAGISGGLKNKRISGGLGKNRVSGGFLREKEKRRSGVQTVVEKRFLSRFALQALKGGKAGRKARGPSKLPGMQDQMQ